MRIILSLNARRDLSYVNNYHHHARGLIWDMLKNTEYDPLHDNSYIPKFSYSNPIPRTDYSEGQNVSFIISSPHKDLIRCLKKELKNREELNIGEMAFELDEASIVNPFPDTGKIGTLQCDTGIYIPVNEEQKKEYNIEDGKGIISWTPRYSLELFENRFIENLNWKINTTRPKLKRPSSFWDVFEDIEFGSTYPIKIKTTSGEDQLSTYVPVTFRADYITRSEKQEEWIKVLLECGCGWKNALGFGFTNIRK